MFDCIFYDIKLDVDQGFIRKIRDLKLTLVRKSLNSYLHSLATLKVYLMLIKILQKWETEKIDLIASNWSLKIDWSLNNFILGPQGIIDSNWEGKVSLDDWIDSSLYNLFTDLHVHCVVSAACNRRRKLPSFASGRFRTSERRIDWLRSIHFFKMLRWWYGWCYDAPLTIKTDTSFFVQ